MGLFSVCTYGKAKQRDSETRQLTQSNNDSCQRTLTIKESPMLRLLAVAVLLLTLAGSALAYACTSHTIWQNGRLVFCQTCCWTGGSCSTSCF